MYCIQSLGPTLLPTCVSATHAQGPCAANLSSRLLPSAGCILVCVRVYICTCLSCECLPLGMQLCTRNGRENRAPRMDMRQPWPVQGKACVCNSAHRNSPSLTTRLARSRSSTFKVSGDIIRVYIYGRAEQARFLTDYSQQTSEKQASSNSERR